MTQVERRTRRIDVGEVELAVTEAGEGPPVLLLHGFPDRAAMWDHQVDALAAAGHHVVAPDLRGFGESDRPDGVDAYRMRRLVGDVVGLLDALGLERAAVVGHDWGAGLAWTVAMAVPERVERLAVLSVGHGGAAALAGDAQRQRSWYMLWFLLPGVAEQALPADDWAFYRAWSCPDGPHRDLEQQVADLARPGALAAALGWYRANIDPVRFVAPELPGAPRVTCPTMGVWSDGDPFLGEDQMQLSQHFVDGPWRYERLDGVDHWIAARAPERLSALLVDFLHP